MDPLFFSITLLAITIAPYYIVFVALPCLPLLQLWKCLEEGTILLYSIFFLCSTIMEHMSHSLPRMPSPSPHGFLLTWRVPLFLTLKFNMPNPIIWMNKLFIILFVFTLTKLPCTGKNYVWPLNKLPIFVAFPGKKFPHGKNYQSCILLSN